MTVRLPPGGVAAGAGSALAALGLRSVMDLQLLGKAALADELMGDLKAAGLVLGDWAKIRLLVGDGAHLGPLSRRSAHLDAQGLREETQQRTILQLLACRARTAMLKACNRGGCKRTLCLQTLAA